MKSENNTQNDFPLRNEDLVPRNRVLFRGKETESSLNKAKLWFRGVITYPPFCVVPTFVSKYLSVCSKGNNYPVKGETSVD